jgi:hypothetical protein
MTLSFLVGIGGIVCTWLVPGGCFALLMEGSSAACRKQCAGLLCMHVQQNGLCGSQVPLLLVGKALQDCILYTSHM